MQSVKEFNQQDKKEDVPETHYLYIQNSELYCTNCDFIGYYLLHKECWICDAKWPEGKEPKEEFEEKDLEFEQPISPAPLVMQLSIPHIPDAEEFKEYNRQLDELLTMSSIGNNK